MTISSPMTRAARVAVAALAMTVVATFAWGVASAHAAALTPAQVIAGPAPSVPPAGAILPSQGGPTPAPYTVAGPLTQLPATPATSVGGIRPMDGTHDTTHAGMHSICWSKVWVRDAPLNWALDFLEYHQQFYLRYTVPIRNSDTGNVSDWGYGKAYTHQNPSGIDGWIQKESMCGL